MLHGGCTSLRAVVIALELKMRYLSCKMLNCSDLLEMNGRIGFARKMTLWIVFAT